MSPPTLSPPALHFVVIDFTITCGTMQLIFQCTTDVACHLTLHMADIDPIVRKIPYQKRGANFNLSSVTCFVEIHTIDQDESGDTTTHTFTVPLTAYDQLHYWYLTGTQGGVPMKSISQIFKASCSKPLLVTTCSGLPKRDTTYSQCHGTIYHMYFKPNVSQSLKTIRYRCGKRGSYIVCNRRYAYIYDTDPVTKIPANLLAYDVQYMTPPYDWQDVIFDMSGVHLNAGQLYTFCYTQNTTLTSQWWNAWGAWERCALANDCCKARGYNNWWQMYNSGGRWYTFSGRILYEFTATPD